GLPVIIEPSICGKFYTLADFDGHSGKFSISDPHFTLQRDALNLVATRFVFSSKIVFFNSWLFRCLTADHRLAGQRLALHPTVGFFYTRCKLVTKMQSDHAELENSTQLIQWINLY
ncbi:MAG: hypothetical protein JNL84_09040, partial [Candidatus Accumulibacter sp.]|nr:hypothetical protein [Accumulibacter sp.]